MKIDLAVWTAVNGYDWQPGSVYSPKELAGYKDEIGPLVPDSLPLGGLFLKDGRAVFYRVQIADRMDSRGRGAIYCVLGTVPADRVKEVDFAAAFNSPEMAQPQKPFPTAIELNADTRESKSPLGTTACNERRFTGVETFSELGGWCDEAKGGKLNVRITGSMDAPLFTVNYRPYVEPVADSPKPPHAEECHAAPHGPPYGQPSRPTADRFTMNENPPSRQVEGAVSPKENSFLKGFVFGMIVGMVVTVLLMWLFWPSK